MDGNIVFYMVYNFYDDSVTLPCNDSWARELAIYSNHALCLAQMCHILQLYLQHHHTQPKKQTTIIKG